MLAIPMPEGIKAGLIEPCRQTHSHSLQLPPLVRFGGRSPSQLSGQKSPPRVGQHIMSTSTNRLDPGHCLQQILQLAAMPTLKGAALSVLAIEQPCTQILYPHLIKQRHHHLSMWLHMTK